MSKIIALLQSRGLRWNNPKSYLLLKFYEFCGTLIRKVELLLIALPPYPPEPKLHPACTLVLKNPSALVVFTVVSSCEYVIHLVVAVCFIHARMNIKFLRMCISYFATAKLLKNFSDFLSHNTGEGLGLGEDMCE